MKRAQGAARGVVRVFAICVLTGLVFRSSTAGDLSGADLARVVGDGTSNRSNMLCTLADSARDGLNGADVAAALGPLKGFDRSVAVQCLEPKIQVGLTGDDFAKILGTDVSNRSNMICTLGKHAQSGLGAGEATIALGGLKGFDRSVAVQCLEPRIQAGLTGNDLAKILGADVSNRSSMICTLKRHVRADFTADDSAFALGELQGFDRSVAVQCLANGAKDALPFVPSAGGGQNPTGRGASAPSAALVERLIKAVPEDPPYLYDVDTVSGAVSTVATDLFGSKAKRVLYDEYYYAAIDYRSMAGVQLALARKAAANNAEADARGHVSEAMKLLDRRNAFATAATNVYLGNVGIAYARVEPVYQSAQTSAQVLALLDPSPATATAVDLLFTGTDFYVNRANSGIDVARQTLVRDVAVMVLMETPSAGLGGRSISDVLKADTTKRIGSSGIYDVLNEQLQNPVFQKRFMSTLAKTGAAGAELVAEAAFNDLLRSPNSGSIGAVLLKE